MPKDDLKLNQSGKVASFGEWESGKLTQHLKIDAWKTFAFPSGGFWPILSGKVVSFGECILPTSSSAEPAARVLPILWLVNLTPP